jgi:hypothetical protein
VNTIEEDVPVGRRRRRRVSRYHDRHWVRGSVLARPRTCDTSCLAQTVALLAPQIEHSGLHRPGRIPYQWSESIRGRRPCRSALLVTRPLHEYRCEGRVQNSTGRALRNILCHWTISHIQLPESLAQARYDPATSENEPCRRTISSSIARNSPSVPAKSA